MRRADHAGSSLVAGAYTPVALISLGDAWRTTVLAVVWSGAFAAALCKFCWVAAPRWLSAAFGLRPRLDRPLPRISPPAALPQEEPAKEGGLRTPKHDNDDLPDRHKAPPSLSTLGEIDLTADEFHPSARSNANADARSRAPDRNHALIQLRSPACLVTRLWRWRARYRLVARGCSGRRCRTNAGVRLRAIPLREGRSDRAA